MQREKEFIFNRSQKLNAAEVKVIEKYIFQISKGSFYNSKCAVTLSLKQQQAGLLYSFVLSKHISIITEQELIYAYENFNLCS